MTRIEVVHNRHPDYGCETVVFVDGVRCEDWTEYSVDPGAGYQCGDLRESMEADLAACSPAIAKMLAEDYEYAFQNQYTEHTGTPSDDHHGRCSDCLPNETANLEQVPECVECGAPPTQAHDPLCKLIG